MFIVFALIGALSLIQEPPIGTPDRPDGALADHQAAMGYVRAGAWSAFAGIDPQVTVSSRHDMLLRGATISFHRIFVEGADGRRQPHWFARRRSAHWVDVQTRWADGRACPAMGHALVLIEEIEAPTLRLANVPFGALPLPGDDAERDIILDDWTYGLRGTAVWGNTGAHATLEHSGGSTSPLASVVIAVDELLAECWFTQSPLPEQR